MHEPQATEPPHPSEMPPQFLPAGHVVAGVQPQTFVMPLPPQLFGDEQLPQEIDPPQPSGALPQF